MAQVIQLKDGPHNLQAPTMRVTSELQRLGYSLAGQFTRLALVTNTKLSEPQEIEGKEMRLIVQDDESADMEWNVRAIADHIAAVMRDPEWDSARVEDNMDIDELGNYYSALVALGVESYAEGESDPKA